jgi:hypothetical protein
MKIIAEISKMKHNNTPECMRIKSGFSLTTIFSKIKMRPKQIDKNHIGLNHSLFILPQSNGPIIEFYNSSNSGLKIN